MDRKRTAITRTATRMIRLHNHFLFKKTMKLISLISIVLFSGCSFSDENHKLPGGHTYVKEGPCYNFILSNFKDANDIGSFIVDYKYDEEFLTVAQIDSAACVSSIAVQEQEVRFFIIDNFKRKLLGPLDRRTFEQTCNSLGVPNTLQTFKIN